ncbi:hypothetical protein [Aureispira anguillae]|nr:hypothetical protein [Aureispira anguillae]
MLNKKQILLGCFSIILSFLCSTTLAQITDSTAAIYPPINENLFVNTKWKYTYTTHAESNTIIHKADEAYAYYLFFRYDYGYQTYLNGTLSGGLWQLNKEQNEVKYNFRRVEWWRIASFSEEALILEFTMNKKSSYRYHFIRVADADAPFERSPNDLPDINVNFAEDALTKETDSYTNFLAQRGIKYKPKVWQRRKAKRARREKRRIARLEKTKKGRAQLAKEEPKELMQIELVGGGFYGGVDPVYRNMILIKTDGRIIKEYQSELQGLQVSKHNISRENLEKLVAYIEEKNFFEFDQIYTCDNQDCIKRLSNKPRPIALRIAITKGVRRKIITIPIWDGRGKANSFINYPKELDAIVQAIENIANVPPQ